MTHSSEAIHPYRAGQIAREAGLGNEACPHPRLPPSQAIHCVEWLQWSLGWAGEDSRIKAEGKALLATMEALMSRAWDDESEEALGGEELARECPPGANDAGDALAA